MSDSLFSKEAAEALAQDWELSLPDMVNEARILDLLSAKISRLLEGSPEVFFGLMYRLDIPEDKLADALKNQNDAVKIIACQVYHRQLQKIESRARYKKPNDFSDDELIW